jgi:O-antigen/teichoic acid export membrane protein
MVGLKSGVVRYISFYLGKNDYNRVKGTIFSSIKIILPVSIIFTILLFLFSEKISLIIFNNVDLIPILKLFSLTIPFIALSHVFLSVIISYQKIEYQVGIKEVLENIIKLVITFILIYFGYDLFGASIAYVISVFFTFCFSFYVLQKKIFSILNKDTKVVMFTKELLKFSFPLLFVGIFVSIIKWTSILIMGIFRTASEVGVYNVALPTANLLVLVPTGMMALFLPIITMLYSKKNKKEIKGLVIRTSKWIFFLNLPIFLMLFLFSKQVLKIMFGPEYIIGYISLSILLFAYLIDSLSHVNSSLLVMLKKTKLIFLVGAVTAIFNITFNLLLIPSHGIIGGATANLVSLILGYTLYACLAYKFTKIFAINLSYLKFILAGIISSLIILLIKTKIEISIISLIGLSLTFALIYFILSLILKSFDEQDESLFLSIKNKILEVIKKNIF